MPLMCDMFFSLSLYAMYKMVGCVQNELNSMRDGLHDVIPLELLSGLAAEVSQLLMYATFIIWAKKLDHRHQNQLAHKPYHSIHLPPY